MAKSDLGVAYTTKRRGEKMLHAKPGSLPSSIEAAANSGDGGKEGKQPADALHSKQSINEDIVEAILAKRKFASGGMVEDAGQVDDKFMPINQFSEHGDPNAVDSPGPDKDMEADDQDLVAQILKSRKSKRA